MILSEKEMTTVKDLQNQEESCIKKYGRYAEQAQDTELKNLFRTLQKSEQQHYNSLDQVLNGNVMSVDCNDTSGKDYQPKASYNTTETEAKKNDCFLATDCIGTEKLVSSEYNNDVFNFGNSDVRKLLADIQIEEQNHAEMLYKYKMANHMS